MPFIGKLPDVGAFRLIDSITTSATDTYALQVEGLSYFPSSARNLIVSLNGVTQAPESAYTVSGSNIIFASALTASDVIDYILVIGESVDIGTPSDNTVGNAQLKSDLDFSGKNLTFSADQISGDAINGGTISSFASTGIDDNATSTAITIDSSQNVGIGTSSPAQSLEVDSGGTITRIRIAAETDYAEFYSDTNGVLLIEADKGNTGSIPSLRFSVSNSEAMRIDSSGNVGIGTSSPASIMHVEGDNPTFTFGSGNAIDSNPTIGKIEFYSNDNSTNSSGEVGSVEVIGIGTWNGASNNAAMTFNLIQGLAGTTSPVEAMRIDSSGNLLVGTTSSTGDRVRIVGSGTTSAAEALSVDDGAGQTLLSCRNDGLINTGTRATSPYNLTTANAANLHVLSNGTLYRSTSSRKYKNDIQDATWTGEQIDALRPVNYKGINDGDKVFGGFIAEEVHEAGLTEFVEYNEAGEPDALMYGHMVSLLVKEIQQLRARVAQLEES